MKFLYPYFLVALLILVVPVIIHLFNFKRYKTVYFSNVPLLKKIRQDSKKKSKLKQLLILTARMLALASLVFAFSRPYIPVGEHIQNKANPLVAIYLDNSFSMKNEGETGPLLEQAKAKAVEIAGAYRPGTQFLLETCDFLPRHQFILNKQQLIQEVSKIKESPRSPKLSEVYHQLWKNLAAAGRNAEKVIYLISDFQKSGADIQSFKPDTSVWTYMLPLVSAKTNNLMIDSCWFDVPGRKLGKAEKLLVRIKNLGAQAYQNIPVRLLINDTLKALTNLTIGALEETTAELNYSNNSPGIQLCRIELDDYPIIYDNTFFMSYQVMSSFKALGIYSPERKGSEYIKALFNNDELVSYDEIPETKVPVSQLKNYQCLFLINNQPPSSGLQTELRNFVSKGGSLIIFPPHLSDYKNYNTFLMSMGSKSIIRFDTLKSRIGEINYQNEIYAEAFLKKEKEPDLPAIKGKVTFEQNMMRTSVPLLKFDNNNEALSYHRFGNGKVYVFAFMPDEANLGFVKHPIFVPTIYNMVLNSGEHQKYAYSTAAPEPVVLNEDLAPAEVTVQNLQTGSNYITDVRRLGSGKTQLVVDEFVNEAGHYLIKSGSQVIQALSYNYPRTESTTACYSGDELKTWKQTEKNHQLDILDENLNLTQALTDANNGKSLWKYFIGLALIFLLTEAAIIRFVKS